MNDLKSIVINIISGFMTEACVSFFEKRRFKKYKKELEKWIQEYVDKNDGTIVTSGAFVNFVRYQKPVEKILAYIYESYNQTLTEEMFLDSLCYLMKAYMETDGLKIKPEEEGVVKDFFQGIYDSYKKYVANGLSMKDRNMLAIMAQVRCGNTEILKRIEEQSNLTRQQSLVLNSYIVDKETSDTDDDTIWQMYHELDKLILEGKIELIQGILPICCYGNENIEQALSLKLDILCKNGHEKDEIVKKLERISVVKIRDDVIRFMIFTIKDVEFFKEIKELAESNELTELLDIYSEGNWDELIKIVENEEDGGGECHIQNLEKYQNENEVRNHIILVYLCSIHPVNMIEVIDGLIKKDFFIDYVLQISLCFQYLISFAAEGLDENEIELCERWYRELLDMKDGYRMLSVDFTVNYFELLLQLADVLNVEEYNELIKDIPDEVKECDQVKARIYIGKIKQHCVNIDDIIAFCINSKNYFVLVCYINEYKLSAENVIEIFEKCSLLLERDFSLFNIYINALCRNGRKGQALEILEEYEKHFDNVLDYWIIVYHLKGTINIMTVYEKWYTGIIQSNDWQTELDLANYLSMNEHNQEAENILDILEKRRMNSYVMQRLRAKILFDKGFQIEALDKFLLLFEERKNDEYVVDMVITLSLNNMRSIDQEVIEQAILFDTPRLLMLVSIALEKKNERYRAQEVVMRGILKSDGENFELLNRYLMLTVEGTENEGDVKKVTCVGEDTAIYLRNCVDAEKIIYCIFAKQILPANPYTWQGTVCIYVNNAGKIGLIRKKIGDHIEIDNMEYVVENIVPLEAFFFGFCTEKLVNNGLAQKFSMKENATDFSDLITWIKENTLTNDVDYLEQYKDYKRVAWPLFAINKFTDMSYVELIWGLMEDNQIVIRSMFSTVDREENQNFVIMSSALSMMYKLGVDVNEIRKSKSVITKSIVEKVSGEEKKIYKENNRELVAKMGVINDELFVNQKPEDMKVKVMHDISDFAEFMAELTKVENKTELKLSGIDSEKFKSIIGVCDYDTLAIAVENNYIIVSGEDYGILFSNIKEINTKSVCIIDYLWLIGVNANNLIEYMIKMVNFRFQVFITPRTLEYLMRTIPDIRDDDAREAALIRWIDFLAMGEEIEDEYSDVFYDFIMGIFSILYENYKDSTNPVWKLFTFFVRKYYVANKAIEVKEDGFGKV